jgi:signal transduction histidine kinase
VAVDRRIRDYQRSLRRLTSELALAEARERREIAADLHDHIGQALAYVSQKVTFLRGNAVFSGSESDFDEILSILSKTIRYTRDLTVEISPPVLYELGLSAAIDWLSERAARRYQLVITPHQIGSPRVVSEAVEVSLSKAVQELIVNVFKHAQAKRITITTIWEPDFLEVSVVDDGIGFDTICLERDNPDETCFGLFSIRERLSYLGGEFSVRSAPGHGTVVTMRTGYNSKAECVSGQNTSG